MKSVPPTEPRELLHRSALHALQLAISICDVRHGVVQLAAGPLMASDAVVPLEVAERLLSLAAHVEGPLAVLEEARLRDISPAIRFYASVKLVDSLGASRGTLAIFDESPHSLTQAHEELLLGLAAQLSRQIEMADLAERSAAEQRHLQWLADEAPVAFFYYGISSGRFSYVNARLAKTLGYTVREMLELESVTDIIVDDQRELVSEMIARRAAGDDRDVRYVTRVRCRDGTELDAEVHSSMANAARSVVGVVVDVTSQRVANQQLHEREEYFRALTDNLSVVIGIVSREAIVTYVSPSVARVFGHDPEELLGKVGWPMVHPDDQELLAAVIATAVKGHAFVHEELRIHHKSGKWRTVEVACGNLLDHPQIRGLVFNLHDITDRKRMEEELRQLDRLTSLGRLATQVAHEFNNVLMGIQPIVEVIRRRATGDPILLRFTEVLIGSVRRGKRITTDILRFARPAQIAVRPIDVQQLLEQAADEIRPLLGEGIKLQLSLDTAPMQIDGDFAQLVQVVVNLALNARDAMESGGGALTLAARYEADGELTDSGAFIHLWLSDTGTGIDSEDLPYIFEPLFTTKRRGTGLGLSVVFQVVTAHRGRISVESERGKGTTFHLFIPAGPPGARREEVIEQKEDGVARRPLRVLIVEDEDAVAQGLRWSLEAEGIDVHIATRGADVLPAITAFGPDVMVLDLSLPDEDGRAIYQRVSAVSPLPVVFSSGEASEAVIAELAQSSRTAFLMKPYATEELLEAIDRVVGGEGKNGDD
jgi:PAS domain S-box-containing protein